MLDQRLRRFPNIAPTQSKCIMFPVNTKHLYDFIQCWTNVEDVGPTLYKCYTIVLCLLGPTRNVTKLVYQLRAFPANVKRDECDEIVSQSCFKVGPASETMGQH